MESLLWGRGRFSSLPPISLQSFNIEVHGPRETVVVVIKQTVAFQGSTIHPLVLLGWWKYGLSKLPALNPNLCFAISQWKAQVLKNFKVFFFIWKKWDGEFGILRVQGYSAKKTINILGRVIILIKWLFMQLALVQSQSFLVDFKGL